MALRMLSTPRTRTRTATIGFVNLGCSKNQVDSEVMLGTLARDGFTLTDNPARAEVVIINTCGFIEEAKQESINAIIEHGVLKKTGDRKSTRLNSSHSQISYAVFCLKKKNKT